MGGGRLRGLDWAGIEPYYKKSEANSRGGDDVHGGDGPLVVGDSAYRGVLPQAFLDSAVAAGHPLTEDFNGAEQDGVGWYQTTITAQGRRASAAVCYLHPVMERPNLTVETHLQVTKVLFEGSRAVGVEALRLSELTEYRAAREVILCGGAYNSPQLLTLSGVGRPDELALLQIPVVAEVTGVGLNLSDHPSSGGTFQIKGEDSLKDALNDETLAEWMGGGGPLSVNGAQAGGFLRTRSGLPVPDVQFHLVSAIFEQEGLIPPPVHGFSMSSCVLRPESRGQVAVVSPDPTTKPLIIHNYLAEAADMHSQIAGVRALMEIVATGPLADLTSGPHLAPAGDDDAAIEAHIRATTQTIYHPVGTCKMGTAA